MSSVTSSPTADAVDHRRRILIRRINLSAAWGEGLDGYDLGVLSVVLPAITVALGMSPVEAGLVGASSLIGIFVGAPLAGWLSDRFGRQRMFTIDILCFVVLGLAQAFVTDTGQLFVMRVLLGMAIGAEYAIGAAMLAEFAPSKGRGRRLSALLVCWYGGFLVAVVVAYAMTAGGLSWRWVLATSVIPAAAAYVIRFGVPESPRWLLSHGRTVRAREVIDRHLGDEYVEREGIADETRRRGGYRELFRGENRRRLIFLAVFWACNVAPYFAIFTFAPVVLESLDLGDPTAGTIGVNALATLGALVGALTIERLGRRKQLIPPFWIMAVALAVVGIWSGAPAWATLLCFAVFAFFNALQGNLTAVYPIEIMPTEVRSSAVGVAAAASRVGAAVGTFLLPVGISTIGTGWCMLIGAGICVIGAVVSQVRAPETTGKTLAETSR
ncbi:MFS transporter [Cnuibacter physcomitrellae]|uniref:MFS transporter n=1 Tax=Cnuibacter physcomitrellae TaxID=1619308 RepID=A0A1X9LKU0_9MICO|nr:MFS transporter [Cnuibacter physcomitrellae]ARJ05826.1 MFS transporter [Cnuibacter physcomitrellae]GGI36576.1 MFS transporter [Cnuibacter physcomitrellae]